MNPRYSIQSFFSATQSLLAQGLSLGTEKQHAGVGPHGADGELNTCSPPHSSMNVFDGGWPPKAPGPAVADAQRHLTPARSLLEKAFCPQCSCHPGLWPDAFY
jgi:hypothetical protein